MDAPLPGVLRRSPSWSARASGAAGLSEYLALERDVAAGTQNQALSALLFFHRHARENPLQDLGDVARAKQPKRRPVVLQFVIRDAKGAKDRVTMLPESLAGPLRDHLAGGRRLWDRDREAGVPGVYLPPALAEKYPTAPVEWGWQWGWLDDNGFGEGQGTGHGGSGLRFRIQSALTIRDSALCGSPCKCVGPGLIPSERHATPATPDAGTPV